MISHHDGDDEDVTRIARARGRTGHKKKEKKKKKKEKKTKQSRSHNKKTARRCVALTIYPRSSLSLSLHMMRHSLLAYAKTDLENEKPSYSIGLAILPICLLYF